MTNVTDLNSHKPALIRLTKTMLNKGIIDANTSVRNLSKLLGINFDDMSKGDKETVDAQFLDGTPTRINFYRTANRADRRLSIQGIKNHARIGDTVAITTKTDYYGNTVLVINISIETQFAALAERI